MFQTLFTRRALKEKLGTRRALGTWVLKALGHLGTWALKTLGHSGTEYSGTQRELGHSDTQVLQTLRALYLADLTDVSKFSQIG